MRILRKLLLLTASLAAALGLVSGTAAAGRLSISNRNIRVEWPAASPLTLRMGSVEVTCPVTIEGSFHFSTIAKTASLIGHITRAVIPLPACTSVGDLEPIPTSLPWHIRYLEFEGTLPNIGAIRLLFDGIGVRLLNMPFCGSARYLGTAEGVAAPTATSTSLSLDEAAQIPRIEGSAGVCPEELGGFRGTRLVTLLGTATNITIRLI